MRGAERFGGDRSEKGRYCMWVLQLHVQTRPDYLRLIVVQIVVQIKKGFKPDSPETIYQPAPPSGLEPETL